MEDQICFYAYRIFLDHIIMVLQICSFQENPTSRKDDI